MATRACDMCGAMADTAELVRYSAADFKDLVAAGFSPADATLEKLRAASGGSSLIALLTWKHGLVRQSETDWLLCRPCTSEAAPYAGMVLRAYGHSIEEAKQEAAARLAQAGSRDSCVLFDIISEVRQESARGQGMSTTEAAENAAGRIPPGAFDLAEPEVVTPPTALTFKCEAYSEIEVRQSAEERLGTSARVDKVTCETPPRQGFLGIGRKPGTWSVEYTTTLSVDVQYRVPAEVRAVRVPRTDSLVADLRRYEATLVGELDRVSVAAGEDRRAFERESQRTDFLLRAVMNSMQSGLSAGILLDQRPMSWPNHVNRELELVRRKLAACEPGT